MIPEASRWRCLLGGRSSLGRSQKTQKREDRAGPRLGLAASIPRFLLRPITTLFTTRAGYLGYIWWRRGCWHKRTPTTSSSWASSTSPTVHLTLFRTSTGPLTREEC